MKTSHTPDPGDGQGTADGPLATVQRIFRLLWDAIPFLDAIGDSFQALTDDPADDVASRAVIPAHVKSLLGEVVVELSDLERAVEHLLQPELSPHPTTDPSARSFPD